MSEGKTHLDELLSDPMVQLVMERDRVRPDELRRLIVKAVDGTDTAVVPPAHLISACRAAGLCA
ncbi:hypothetical protein [Oryzicola mucosus]|uniref:Uncharacterized protein n=1 Tax=Oryzicola mucosus TaxID=2767425 RepID=A0A8J6U5N4_9HYPH|nr:hypothetical protein [Oryzicola mucosus]MBD0416605.1 hypothetical protein [Oryzicola mucosus]